mgnify:CR=1 FL=1
MSFIDRNLSDIPSELIGLKNTAGNAHAQNDQSGGTIAIRVQASAEKADETATRYSAAVFRTRRPVMMFVRIPQTTVGRKRRDVSRAPRCWISSKL